MASACEGEYAHSVIKFTKCYQIALYKMKPGNHTLQKCNSAHLTLYIRTGGTIWMHILMEDIAFNHSGSVGFEHPTTGSISYPKPSQYDPGASVRAVT